ncbi:MAG: SGNH hydrolase domain-containing protein [Candidatus Nanopelagicales bacterium]
MTPEQARRDVGDNYRHGCHIGRAGVAVNRGKDCTFGAARGKQTVVLYGDSHAAQWFPPLAALARAEGWRLITLTKVACPVGDVVVFNKALKRRYRECESWRADALRQVKALRPQLVVVASRADYYQQFRSGRVRSVEASRAALGRALGRDLGRLRSPGTRVVLLRDTIAPNVGNVPDCIEHRGSNACRFSRAVATPVDSHQLTAARRAGVKVVRMRTPVCATSRCDVVRDGMIMYRDDDHLTATFALSLRRALSSRLPLL